MSAAAEALAVAAHWGGAGSLRLIRERENAVFEVGLPQGRAALRLHRVGYQTEAAIRSELWWCGALADAGVAVPRPVAALDGALVRRTGSGRCASVIAWAEGPAIGEARVPLAGAVAAQAALHVRIGALVAQMHLATDALRLPDWFTRPAWDLPGLLGEVPFWGRFWDHPALTPAEAGVMAAVRAHLAARLGAHAAAGGSFGPIHADVLRENVLDGPSGLTLIDFDDAGFGFRLYDLGTVLSQSLDEPALPQIAGALVEGYAAVRPLSAADRALIPEMTLMRCCASVGWTMPRHAPDSPIMRLYIERALRLADKVLAGRGFGG